jgi:hypothetical protein
MVTGVSARAWNTGDHRRLEVRWLEAAQEYHRLSGSAPTAAMTESALYDLRRQIARLQPAEQQWDPAVADAEREFSAAVTRYAQLHFSLLKRQREMARLRESPDHILLGDVTPNLLQPMPTVQQAIDALFGVQGSPHDRALPGAIIEPRFPTVTAAREGRREFLRYVDAIQGVHDKMDAVTFHETLPPADKAHRLVLALATKVDALADRIVQLERERTTSKPQRRGKNG